MSIEHLTPLKDAVLEIGCEELPSSYIRPAIDQMVAAAEASLKEHKISYQNLYTYYTPRRLTLFFKGLPEMQSDDMKEVTGPLVSIAFDQHGLPTRAGEGFAKGQGVSAASLKRKMTPKGEVVVAVKKGGGRLTSEIMGEIFPEVIKKIRFPRFSAGVMATFYSPGPCAGFVVFSPARSSPSKLPVFIAIVKPVV